MNRTITQPKKNKLLTGKYEALLIAQYLMTLDPKRKYFTNTRMKVSKTSISAPQVGNIRLNNLLYLLKILYYLKYQEILFNDELLAFEQGPIVYNVYNNFCQLYYDTTSNVSKIDLSTKKFLREWFTYFQEYSTTELMDIVHEDPAWCSTWQKNENPRLDLTSTPHLNFYKKHFVGFFEHKRVNAQ